MTTAEQFESYAPATVDRLARVFHLPGSTAEVLADAADSPEAHQQAALAKLPQYQVEVVRRRTHAEPVETANYTIYQESVRYSDGAVRLVTMGLPKLLLCGTPVLAGDPWFTGPDGFNRIEIEQIVMSGLPVIWNHHQGRHSVLPTSRERVSTMAHSLANKSLAKSAAQDHALLRHLRAAGTIYDGSVIRRGYSRAAMSGEAFIAQAAGADCQVIWSDLEAACFARRVGKVAFARLLLRQYGHEVAALGEVGIDLLQGKSAKQAAKAVVQIAGTADLSPQNLAHEFAWFGLLINGEAGRYAEAIPLDSQGVRTIYQHDYSGQQADWRRIHAVRPGITIVEEAGAHLSGASARMQATKVKRLQRLAAYARNHGDLAGLSAADVLPTRAA